MTSDAPATTSAPFIADAAGIDFLNSVATPVDVPFDWIDDGHGYVSWLRQAGLVPGDQLDVIVGRATPDELDRVAGQARALREWFRDFVREHMGQAVGVGALSALEPLNHLLERDEAYHRLAVAKDGGLALDSVRRWRSPEALLIPLAEAIARTVVDEDFKQIKACEGHNCTMLFVDRTRGRARRWCTMAVCGNRAKVAAHRRRHKAG